MVDVFACSRALLVKILARWRPRAYPAPVPPRAVERQLKLAALNAADRRALPDEPLRWSDAMAEAPWPVSLGFPVLEKEFRRAYAARLVKRGAAVAAIPNRGGASGPSGVSKLMRRSVRMTKEEFAATDAKVEAAGASSWNDWVRRKLTQ